MRVNVRARRGPGRPAGGKLVVDRELLLDAAERVIARDGAGASIEAIAAEAGVTKPIVYARVGARAELCEALAERFTDRLTKSARDRVKSLEPSRDALVQLFRATGDQQYLARARETADAALELFAGERLWQQAPVFNAIFFRNLLALHATSPDPKYLAAVDSYLERAWTEGRDPETVRLKRAYESEVEAKVASDHQHIVWAYGVIWVLFVGYGMLLWRRANAQRADLERLQKR